MCGRFSVAVSKEELEGYLENYFSVGLFENIQLPRYNVAPTQPVATLIFGKGAVRFGSMTWGIFPRHKKGGSIINARAETIFEKPLFKSLVKSRRCLIPADGFYEWKKVETAKKPYRIVLTNHPLFLMAGIYQMTGDRDITARCAIVTTEANEKMSSIHARMPVILTPDDGRKWLDSKSDQDELQSLLKPYREDDMDMYPVSEIVNRAMNDTKACLMKKEEV